MLPTAPDPATLERRVWPLLADEDGHPWLPDGVSLDQLQPKTAPPPAQARAQGTAPLSFVISGADQNQLSQGWGVVVPRGERQRVGWIRALYELRAEDPALASFARRWSALRAGGDPRSLSPAEPLPIFELDPERAASAQGVHAWVEEQIGGLKLSEDPRAGERVVPLYLLLLGDLHELPVHLEHALGAHELIPGRLAFTRADGGPDAAAYASYAAKVVAHARAPLPDPRVPALLYAPEDGTPAVQLGTRGVLDPTENVLTGLEVELAPYARVRRLLDTGRPDPRTLLEDPDVQGTGVLFTLSHGKASTRDGAEAQRRRQGALSFGYGANALTADRLAEHLRTRPFLPGGVWFLFACFGAGTPASSVYEPWLRVLGVVESVADSRAALALERPFVAALPQVALAHPLGPLAVIGHVDLAWNFAMERHGAGGLRAAAMVGRRFSRVLESLGTAPADEESTGVWGPGRGGPQRVGVAFDQLVAERRSLGLTLTALASRDPGAVLRGVAYPEAWLSYQDLSGYVLLGDPAVHLPLRAPGARASTA